MRLADIRFLNSTNNNPGCDEWAEIRRMNYKCVAQNEELLAKQLFYDFYIQIVGIKLHLGDFGEIRFFSFY